jgi:hypothetical protein
VKSEFAPLAAVSALAVAAEGGVEVEGVVDGDPARPDATGYGAGLVQIGARDIAREPGLGVVGDLDGVVDAVVAEDGQDLGRPIGSFQAAEHACADMLVQVTVARQVVRPPSELR